MCPDALATRRVFNAVVESVQGKDSAVLVTFQYQAALAPQTFCSWLQGAIHLLTGTNESGFLGSKRTIIAPLAA